MIEPTTPEWIPWFVDVFVDNRDKLMEFLKYHNIQTRATYPEINKTPMYLDSIVHPVSQSVSERGLFLPSHTLLTDAEVVHISKLILLFHESGTTRT
jgi:dTDP-4-amino-4,6-dideoxygalactose transaminase